MAYNVTSKHLQNIRSQNRSLKKRCVQYKEKRINIEGTEYSNELNLSISEPEIFSALAKIKSEKSPGMDNISNYTTIYIFISQVTQYI